MYKKAALQLGCEPRVTCVPGTPPELSWLAGKQEGLGSNPSWE